MKKNRRLQEIKSELAALKAKSRSLSEERDEVLRQIVADHWDQLVANCQREIEADPASVIIGEHTCSGPAEVCIYDWGSEDCLFCGEPEERK